MLDSARLWNGWAPPAVMCESLIRSSVVSYNNNNYQLRRCQLSYYYINVLEMETIFIQKNESSILTENLERDHHRKHMLQPFVGKALPNA